MRVDLRAPSRQQRGRHADTSGRNALRWRDWVRWTGPAGGMRLTASFRDGSRRGGHAPAPTRAERWVLSPVPGAADDTDVVLRKDGLARLVISGLFGVSLVFFALGYGLDLSFMRLISLACALVLGVGTAPLQLSEGVPLDVRLGVAGLVGLCVPLVLGSVMVLAPLWHPVGFAVLAGAAAIGIHVTSCRRILSGPLRYEILDAATGARAGVRLDVSLACTAAGTVMWVVAMLMTGHIVPGVLGFLPKVPVFWYLGILLVLAGIVLSRGKGESRAVLGVTSLLAALTLTPAVTYGMPMSQSAAKHLDLVMQILQTLHLNRGAGIYDVYSGFFSGTAWLCYLAGIPLGMHGFVPVATYWPFFIDLLALVGLRFFFGRMISSWYRIWLGITMAVLVNAIGADYFSPQAIGFVLAIFVFALAISDGGALGIGERPRIALLVLAGCALAVAHEFSPYAAGGVLCVLVVFRVIRPWYLPATILVPAVLWLFLNYGVLSGYISIYGLGDLSNFQPPKTIATPGLSRLAIVGESSDALALGLLVLIVIAGIGLLRNRRSRWAWAFMACPGVGLVLIAANPYGNEGIFRAALFAIPWLAAVSLQVLSDSPSRLVSSVYWIVAACLSATYMVAMFGLDNENVIRAGDYQALLAYEASAAPSSYMMKLADGDLPVSVGFPVGYGHYLPWTNVLKPAQAETLTPTRADATSLAVLYYDYAMKNDHQTSELYAIWSPAAVQHAVDYGLETLGQAEAWRSLLIASPHWKVVYAKDGTYIFQVNLATLPVSTG